MRVVRDVLLGMLVATASLSAAGSQSTDRDDQRLVIDVVPSTLTLEVGETARLTATVRSADGTLVEDAAVAYYSRSRRDVGVTRGGVVEAYRPGEFVLVAMVPADRNGASRREGEVMRVEIPVTVPHPPIASVSFLDLPRKFYVGTTPRVDVEVVDSLGLTRVDVVPSYATSDARVAEIDARGVLSLHAPGRVGLTVTAEAASARADIDVDPNPTTALDLDLSAQSVRTGDVVRLTATAKDARGLPVRGMPVRFGVSGDTDRRIIAAGAAAQITADGRFVAERSGVYTVIATTGAHSATRTIQVAPRDVEQDLEVVGRGRVLDRHTSDLWIWEGSDGRDYAITGTWGADGRSYIWDVTDPSDIVLIRDIQVDARTVNDVKVSEEGDIAVISREGASNRRNGFVVLGVGNPREGVPVLSEFTDQLTGGVHNVFISENHVFALSGGRRYDVISIEDPRNPRRVGRFELQTPGHGIHDVWVSDGVAFSSNWADGVVAVDVGGGGRGGSPEHPVELGRYAYPSGWNHAAFPYRSQSTGTFYVFAGDEAFPYGGFNGEAGSTPSRAAGWVHVIDWSEWSHPREVARYEVPEAGSHNLWIEDDLMYVAFYNGGLRVVDVSGELRGDLYRQGREVAAYVPYDPEGYIANAPFVWGPQPYKGTIFFTDWNTGLWAVRLTPRRETGVVVGEPQE